VHFARFVETRIAGALRQAAVDEHELQHGLAGQRRRRIGVRRRVVDAPGDLLHRRQVRIAPLFDARGRPAELRERLGGFLTNGRDGVRHATSASIHS
jgi:hypothetical protein